tara:strand:+ start:1583 stop:2389 length:807 start_codon:yes stop_codon:yes gene_type:complete
MKLGSIALNSFLILLFLYIFVIIFLFFYQRKLLYHPSENNYLDETSLNHNIEKKFIQSENKLVSWYFEKNSDYKTILFFHGNAGKLDNRVYKLNELSKLDLNYLIIAYRGFSGNEGKPTEDGLYKDAKSAKIWLNNNGVKDKDIILYGESLGTAVAVDLASKNKFAGIILESPFTSMTRLAQKYYPIFPVKIILKDKFDSINKIQKINSPLLVMHGEEDTIVPFSMGVEIFEKSNTQKSKYFIKNDDHMMNFDQNLISEIQKFIKSLK